MNSVSSDRNFWRSMAGGAFGLALALVWARFGFWGFVLAAAFAVVGAVAARLSSGDWG